MAARRKVARIGCSIGSKVPAPLNPLLTPVAVMWRPKHASRIAHRLPRNMTAARQQRKSPPALSPVFWLALELAVCGGIFSAPVILAAPSERIVVNADTGLAISGSDPVVYFTDAKPKIGLPKHELRLDGAVWRFRNEGNRAAFAEHPEVYLSAFRRLRCRGDRPRRVGAGSPAVLDDNRRAALSSSIAARRPRPSWPSPGSSSSAPCANGPRSRAPSRAEPMPYWLLAAAALAGSPQAIKPGTRNLSARRPNAS